MFGMNGDEYRVADNFILISLLEKNYTMKKPAHTMFIVAIEKI